MEERSPTATLPKQVVLPLCQPFCRQADCLLDLHEMTHSSAHPGKCVQCFFKLLGAAREDHHGALTPLKAWIEENIEIKIQAGENHAGSFPVRLEAPDLDAFCHEAIQRVREDTAIAAPEVELSFDYKGAAC